VNIFDVACTMARALERAGVEYSIVGALTSMYYGMSRNTMDADFLVELSAGQLADIAAQLPADFVLERQPRFEMFTGKTYYGITVEGTNFRIDLFRLTDDAFDRSNFSRRRKVQLHGQEVTFPSPEDVVVQKLRWQRHKDLSDALDVLAVQGAALDFAYIEHWCDRHGTRALLDKLRSEIPPE
jgi:predicted nucleotidyltransferase